MAEIYRHTHFALYAQVAIWDHQNTDSYPEWFTGEEPATFGKRGVAVATAPDADVQVQILENEHPIGTPVAEGMITVGAEGLDVGNLTAADVGHLEWPPGPLPLRIYTDARPEETTTVIFVFDR